MTLIEKIKTAFANIKILATRSVSVAETVNPSASVEAEYGSTTIEGSLLTLAHHGANSSNPCPCVGDNFHSIVTQQLETILVSHFDLDTLGGVMRLVGLKDFDMEEDNDIFWRLASFIDLNGPHKISGFFYTELKRRGLFTDDSSSTYYCQCECDEAIEALEGFWAWSEANRLNVPGEDVPASDITEHFVRAAYVASLLIEGDDCNDETQSLLAAGKAWKAAKDSLEKESFVLGFDDVILRQSASFVNHLYSHGNCTVKAVVGFNTKFKAVTISLADAIPGFSCAEFAQELWGKEAGGHAGIAGSPRGKEMTLADANAALIVLAERLR